MKENKQDFEASLSTVEGIKLGTQFSPPPHPET